MSKSFEDRINTILDGIIAEGPMSAIEPAVKPLIKMGNVENSVKLLGMIGDKRAVKPLIKLLNNYTNLGVNQTVKSPKNTTVGKMSRAIYALGKIGDPRAIESLIKILKNLLQNRNLHKLSKLGYVHQKDDQ